MSFQVKYSDCSRTDGHRLRWRSRLVLPYYPMQSRACGERFRSALAHCMTAI
nr:MAG TPA: hypothetical protein [Caudoviricetes sp.]